MSMTAREVMDEAFELLRKAMSMNEKEELAYTQGSRSAWARMLTMVLRELGQDSPEWTANEWRIEREATVAALRSLCADFGDNDWPDDMHLADVIDKHLGRALHDARQEPKP